jgi:hypothetical protein
MAAPVLNLGRTAELLLSAPGQPELTDQEMRVTRRGEQIIASLFNGMQMLAEEGSYFLAQTATPGTGIAATSATGTSFSDTQALLAIDNLDTAPYIGGQARNIILDFIMLIVTAAGTASTSAHVAHRLDTAARGSGGTQLGAVGVNPKPSNANIGTSSIARVLFGNPTVAAASASVRNVGRNLLKIAAAPAWVVGDCCIIKFGSAEMGGGGVISGTAAAQFVVNAPAIIIGPGQSYVLNEWAPSRTAAQSMECVVGWTER